MQPAAARHTVSYLARRFSEAGIRLNARHGQNFLIDMNLQNLLVERADIDRRDVVLEVGTGTGALTALIAAPAAAVVTVEVDWRLHQLASEELFSLENVVMLEQDALAGKSRLDARLIDAVQDQLARAPGLRFKLVANLPYSVATPVIANLLASSIVPCTMTVTVQKELGDRIATAPGTRDYSALSVWVQSQCRVELVRVLPPSVFWPRPAVTSAILQIELDAVKREQIPDLDVFHDFVRSLFLHRRKFLRGVLISMLKGRVDKPGVDAILAQVEISPDLRAEQLEVATILRLCEAVRSAC